MPERTAAVPAVTADDLAIYTNVAVDHVLDAISDALPDDCALVPHGEVSRGLPLTLDDIAAAISADGHICDPVEEPDA